MKRVGGPLVELALPPSRRFGRLLQLVLEALNVPRQLQTHRARRRGLVRPARCNVRPLPVLQPLADLLPLDLIDELLTR